MVKKMRWIGLPVLVLLLLVGAQGAAWAGCGTCQVCKKRENFTIPKDFCAVADDENGSMCCSQESFGLATYCTETGSSCYGIVVGGGGGGGGTGGGGGGGCSSSSGWCPAECFSCGGGGGTY